MQVNPIMQGSPSVVKGLTVGEQSAGQAENVGNTALDAAGKLEMVAQTFAKMEKAVLQWFFEQRPELGKALAQLLSLQEQLSNQNTSGTMNYSEHINEKLVKILDMMKMLLISPQGKFSAKTSERIQSPQTLPALIGELEKLKKEQTPEMQTKIDTLLIKLTNLLKNTNRPIPISEEKHVQQSTAGSAVDPEGALDPDENGVGKNQRASHAAENMTSKNESVFSKNTPATSHTEASPMPKQELPTPATKAGIPLAEGETDADLIEAQIKFEKALSTAQNSAHGQKSNPVVTNNEGAIKTTYTNKTEGERIPFNQGQAMGNSGLFQDDESNTGTLITNKQNGLEFQFGPSINKATVMQHKLQEILAQFMDDLNQHEPDDKLRKVLQDMEKCTKALQINPETEWENLLRYPVIYKQTLQKAVKLLQELINTKNSDKVHQKTVNLLSETIANLHVQTSVNQLRQENPANQTMYFQIPLQIGNEIRNGEMLVVHQREKQGNKWEIVNSWYRFYLETQNLGQVQINLHAADKQLNIQFFLTDEEQAGLFNEQKMNLRQVLTHYGYDVVDITCNVGAVAPLFLFDTDNADRQCVDIMI